jgi:major histocompatibility complex class I
MRQKKRKVGKKRQIRIRRRLRLKMWWVVVVAHAFNPSTWEAEAGRFLNSRPTWSAK